MPLWTLCRRKTDQSLQTQAQRKPKSIHWWKIILEALMNLIKWSMSKEIIKKKFIMNNSVNKIKI